VVPKGRYEDAPETLEAWLEAPGVHLLVDGYNVTKAEGGFGDIELVQQRQRLVHEVTRLIRRKGARATVIFDGSNVPPGTSRRSRGPVYVEYSRPTEIADDHLIAKLGDLPPDPVVVATNDRELQGRAAALGATVATSNQLLGLIR
jgi:predicted RNA-binding protein with PIN domain